MRNEATFLTIVTLGLLVIAPVASAGHGISIVSGEPEGDTYEMEVEVTGFNLVPFQDRDAKKGEGHIHYLANGQDACAANKADCSAPTDYATPKKSFTYTNLEGGDVLNAELVLSNHQPSGTDSSGNLDNSRVLASEVQVSNSSPAPGLLVAIGALALVGIAMRRRG